jgi:rRNA maturation endonuclease Nob1
MLSHDVPQPGYWANIFYGDVDVENWKYLRPYRVEYNGYTVKSTANELDKGTVSVVDAIQKALDVVNNEYYDSTGRLFSPNHNTVTNPKYTLADEIKMNPTYSNIYCPEMAFEKGKSLWDVMLELGRLFGGIPRLITGKSDGVIKKNVITFDILKDLTIANNMLSNQTILGTELENINSQITNHTTGYVSQISNMIPKDSIVVYPGSTCWISPRSKTDSDSYVTRTNMSLILDKPIYKIIDVQMTNFNSDNPSSTTSIINHVFEDTVYQSLNNDANGKGSALTWSKGDNKILGLGFLPQETESQAIWGMSSTDYVIQNILKKLGFANLLDANVYKYRIWYIPYTNARVTTEQ